MRASSETFYDRFIFFYPLVDLFLQPQKRRFFTLVDRLPSGRLLDIGVGTGSHFAYYANHNVTGIDSSQRMLAQAESRRRDNITLHHMQAESLAFADNTFDYVVLSHVIAVVDDPEKVLMEAYRVLKPQGKLLILNHFTPRNWLGYADRIFSAVSHALHFRSDFHPCRLRGLKKFTLQSEINAGYLSYFKILTYEKNA